ncbi:hypothetical protein [Brasilonema bromeliae]|nr:hypothetical protein [Brasilonema bromeliae]
MSKTQGNPTPLDWGVGAGTSCSYAARDGIAQRAVPKAITSWCILILKVE